MSCDCVNVGIFVIYFIPDDLKSKDFIVESSKPPYTIGTLVLHANVFGWMFARFNVSLPSGLNVLIFDENAFLFMSITDK